MLHPNYYHFIGIKGAGMTALAQIYKAKGAHVTGSDTENKFFTDPILESLKIPVFQKFQEHNIGRPTVVIASAAYGKENPEIQEAKRKRIKVLTYPQALGQLMARKKAICVAGTHGKTTVTALSGLLLEKAGLDPTVVVGSYVDSFSGNARVGNSRYFAAECCEYKRHFLKYYPKIAILTNVEMDHPDYYKSFSDVKRAFSQFVSKIPENGLLIYCADDPGAVAIAQKTSKKKISYGFSQQAYVRAIYHRVKPGRTIFKVMRGRKLLGQFTIKVPGEHNILNALAIIALGTHLKIKLSTIRQVLREYQGTKRRFELLGKARGITFIDDYAHHPTEVKATLEGAKTYFPKARIVAVFQSHTFSRTKELLGDFGQAFGAADKVVVGPIFTSAREKKGRVSGRDIVRVGEKHHKNIKYFSNFEKIKAHLRRNLKRGDVVITMGAGNIYEVGEDLLTKFRQKKKKIKV